LLYFGYSFSSLGEIAIISMFLFPLLGAILGIKSKRGVGKWLLTLLNVIALIIIGYLLLLSGMGET
jgi:ABC-type dipeptide/oligopeptide/nickel transport system permease component